MGIKLSKIKVCDLCGKEIRGVKNECPVCKKEVCYACSHELGDVYHTNLCASCNRNRPEIHAVLEKWQNHFIEDYKSIIKELQEARPGDSIPDVPYGEQHFRWY